MEVYFVRHGETDYNIQRRYYGCTDVLLNNRGKEQAGKLANFFSTVSLDKILCSPLHRAYDTAKIIQEKARVDIETESLLCEQNFGVFEGKTYQELMHLYPREWEAWNKDFFYTAPLGGESFSKVRQRINKFLEELKKRPEKSILIVAHKGTFGHLLAAMLGLSLEGFWNFVFEQGCYSHISLEDGYAIVRKINESLKEERNQEGKRDGFI